MFSSPGSGKKPAQQVCLINLSSAVQAGANYRHLGDGSSRSVDSPISNVFVFRLFLGLLKIPLISFFADWILTMKRGPSMWALQVLLLSVKPKLYKSLQKL